MQKKIAVIVQCRMSSKRLHGKALLPLGDRPVLAWTLEAMRKVPADFYYVATDETSYDELLPTVRECGWNIFAGPLENVLERFCLLVKKIGADIVVRATADNPFLFYEAACETLFEFFNNVTKGKQCDYITFTGLPHGSGVEIFDAHSLLRAAEMTDSAYDREHVGPALYNHRDNFKSIFVPAPPYFNFPEYRTTIDTERDYRRAQQIVSLVLDNRKKNRGDKETLNDGCACCCCKKNIEPFTTEEIIAALQKPEVSHPILFFPSTKTGQGTGHLRRALETAKEIGATVFVPSDSGLAETQYLVDEAKRDGLCDWQITSEFPNEGEYALIVADCFMLDKTVAQKLSSVATLLAIDEGGAYSDYADFLVDVIPSLSSEQRSANVTEPLFIKLPKNTKTEAVFKKQSDGKKQKVLVCFGGEDPKGFTVPVAEKFADAGFDVTAVCGKKLIEKTNCENIGADDGRNENDGAGKKIKFVTPIPNLREELFRYDIVATHYGLTAYEARAAGCVVITFVTSELHKKLSEKYCFVCSDADSLTKEKIDAAVADAFAADASVSYEQCCVGEGRDVVGTAADRNVRKSLGEFLQAVSFGRKMNCPVCGMLANAKSENVARHENDVHENGIDEIVARTPVRTFRRCACCGIVYMAWTEDSSQRKYSASYFADEYKAQYGRTYLEDFDSIKAQCVRRMENILELFEGAVSGAVDGAKTVLDVGCAYGAFLAAATEAGWKGYGTDISEDAVAYVRDVLKLPAATASFPQIDTASAFGAVSIDCASDNVAATVSEKVCVEQEQFDAVTMWFVIEHFTALGDVLEKVSALVKKGGVFAFSTPSGEGVSAKYNRQEFFEQSPRDHYTIWEPSRASEILKKFGFTIEKIVSTGHHAERFPEVKTHGYDASSPEFAYWTEYSKKNNLGDTFEVYCRKI